MHPIGQILNFGNQREFQNRGTEHVHAPINIVDAPKIDENEGSEVVEFIDKYIICALPDAIYQFSKESADPPPYNHLQEEKECSVLM